jgi:MerR, DNA binding
MKGASCNKICQMRPCRMLALQDQPDIPCGEVDALVAEHVAAMNDRIQRLLALRRELENYGTLRRLAQSPARGRKP